MASKNPEKLIEDYGYEEVMIFKDFDYADAFLGVTEDERAVYDYDLMVQSLMEEEGMSEEDAVEWIDYNTVRSLPYAGSRAPIILHRLE